MYYLPTFPRSFNGSDNPSPRPWTVVRARHEGLDSSLKLTLAISDPPDLHDPVPVIRIYAWFSVRPSCMCR